MAQSPWTVLEDVPICGKEAAQIARRCARDLNRHLGQTQTWNGLVTQVTTLSESIVDLSVKIDQDRSPTVEKNRRREVDSKKNKTGNESQQETQPAYYENQTFYRLRTKGTVQLHPCFLDNADRGVRAYLTNFLLKYVPEFQGIWVAFHPNITTKEPFGFTSEAEAFGIVTFQIEIQCLVFRPRPGCVLAGIVQHVRPTHVVIMVHGLFNVCITKKGLDRRYEFKHGVYISKDGVAAKIKPQCLVAFRVYGYDHSPSGEIMTIQGSIGDRRRCGVLDPETLMLLMKGKQTKVASPKARSRSPNHRKIKDEV